MEKILNTPLRIYTAVWNDRYLNLFEKTILRSFGWKKNKEALQAHKPTWSFHTTKESAAKLIPMCKKLGIEDYEVTELIPQTFDGKTDIGWCLLEHFKAEINRCLETNSKLLLAPPDSLYGDGSIENILREGNQDGVCVAVPHPRVLPSIFEYPSILAESLNDELSNPQLVTESFNHLHRTWSDAQYGLPKINSRVGGVLWKKLRKGLYTVQHHLPTNYLLHFQPSDLQFFEQQIVFGAIDHIWPTKLIQEKRERVIASSDVAFLCEVTEKNENVPPSYPYMESEPDRFWRNAPHNDFFKQIKCTFRGIEA